MEVVQFIKDNGVEMFMSRISTGTVDGENATAGGGATTVAHEEAMMGRMGILVVCRFERLMFEEQVMCIGCT